MSSWIGILIRILPNKTNFLLAWTKIEEWHFLLGNCYFILWQDWIVKILKDSDDDNMADDNDAHLYFSCSVLIKQIKKKLSKTERNRLWILLDLGSQVWYL